MTDEKCGYQKTTQSPIVNHLKEGESIDPSYGDLLYTDEHGRQQRLFLPPFMPLRIHSDTRERPEKPEDSSQWTWLRKWVEDYMAEEDNQPVEEHPDGTKIPDEFKVMYYLTFDPDGECWIYNLEPVGPPYFYMIWAPENCGLFEKFEPLRNLMCAYDAMDRFFCIDDPDDSDFIESLYELKGLMSQDEVWF